MAGLAHAEVDLGNISTKQILTDTSCDKDCEVVVIILGNQISQRFFILEQKCMCV
jgi:hypothetical protein